MDNSALIDSTISNITSQESTIMEENIRFCIRHRLFKISQSPELFNRLDDADKWPGSIQATILIFILPVPDRKVVWRISDAFDGKQWMGG